MKNLKRAMLYITRKKARTILLVLLLAVLFVFMMTSFIIQNNANASKTEFEKTLGTGFSVEVYYDNFYNEWANKDLEYVVVSEWESYYKPPYSLDDEMIATIAALDEVDAYNAQTSYFSTINFEIKPGDLARIYNNMLYVYPDRATEEDKIATKILSQQIGLYGCDESEYHKFFMNGALSLKEGRDINHDDEWKVVISSYLAEQNGLEVGDEFPLVITQEEIDYIYFTNDYEPTEFITEIVGIFDVNFDYGSSDHTIEANIPENMIFIDNHAVKEMVKYRGNEIDYSEVMFFVDDPKDLDSAISAVRDLPVNQEYLHITRDDTSYEAYATPLQSLSDFSTVLFVITAAACFVVLLLLIMMNIRSRTKEMYVYRSIGIGKSNISGQMIFECFVIFLIAFLISILIVGLFAGNIGEMVERMILPESESNASFVLSEDENMDAAIDVVTKSDVDLSYSLTPLSLIIAGGIGFGSMLIAVLASSKRILNKPLCNLKNEIR